MKPTNNFTISFPFSAIKVQQPSEVVVQLAGVVSDLAELVAGCVAPGREGDAAALVERAREVLGRLESE